MKIDKLDDRMVKAYAALNAPNERRHREAVHRKRHRGVSDEITVHYHMKKRLEPVVRAMQRAFRREIPSKMNNAMSFFRWLGDGYLEDHTDNRVKCRLEYEVYFKGLKLRRGFLAKDMTDVTVEAWKLCGVLDAWWNTRMEK